MSAAQAGILRRLCGEFGIPFDAVAGLSKQRAIWVIRGLAVEQPTLSRADVRKASCPECGARPGKACTKPSGEARKANHQTRVNAARIAAR